MLYRLARQVNCSMLALLCLVGRLGGLRPPNYPLSPSSVGTAPLNDAGERGFVGACGPHTPAAQQSAKIERVVTCSGSRGKLLAPG